MNTAFILLCIALLTIPETTGSRSWMKKTKDDYEEKSYWAYKPKPKPKPTKEKCTQGFIQGYFGDLADIPTGYQLCDGSNGTPDLRDKFLVGAGSQFDLGDDGGDFEVGLAEENLPSHGHGAGGLITAEDGGHQHPFSTETNEGGHIHEVVNLEIGSNGLHYHKVDLETDKDGDHNHHFDVYAPEDYGTTHDDFDVPLQKVDLDQSYPMEVSEDDGHKHDVSGSTDQAGDHSHDIDGTVGDDDKDGEHQHAVDGTTEEAGLHIHELSGTTAPVGDGVPFPILPPFNAVYYICCVRKEKPKPSWYH